MSFLWVAEVRRGIPLSPAGGDGVAEDLTADLHRSVGRLQRAAVFNLAKYCQQVQRLDVAARPPVESTADRAHLSRRQRCPEC